MGTKKLQERQVYRFGAWADVLRRRLSDTQRHTLLWIVCGVACGLAAVAFHLAIDLIFGGLMGWAKSFGEADRWRLIALLIMAPCLGGLITGFVVWKYGDAASGSGIPQTKHAFYMKFGFLRVRDAVLRFLIGSISVGSGMSLGREGPTVHICSTVASVLARVFGLAKVRVQAIVPAGMAAGIAAAFNTPIAAMFFAFEELFDHFSSKAIFGILVAVVLADVVERLCLGENPNFIVENAAYVTDWWMLICLPLAVASALLGHLFVRSLLGLRGWFKQRRHFAIWLRPACGGLVVGMIGVTVLLFTSHDGIFGLGYDDLSGALNGRFQRDMLVVLVLLFGGKFVAIILSYASGGSGGLFAPALFLGGTLGAIVGILGQSVFGYENGTVGAVALLGMGSFFGAVIRCPITSVMIVFEMTRNYTLILPLMVGNTLAWWIAARLQPVPLYDALLLQDKISLKRIPSYQGAQDWRNLPVSAIMTFDPFTLDASKSAGANLTDLGDVKKTAYPVVNSKNEVLGLMTHQELTGHDRNADDAPLERLLANRTPIMMDPECSIREAARIFVVKDVRQAPVVRKNHEGRSTLHGIITLHDIARQQNAITDTLGR